MHECLHVPARVTTRRSPAKPRALHLQHAIWRLGRSTEDARGVSTIVALLRRHPAFDRAKPATLAKLARACTVKDVDAGEVLARAKAKHTTLLLVAEGALELSHPIVGTRRHVLLGRIDAPTLFGDATFFGDGVWPVTARAVEDGAVVLVPPRLLDQLIDEDAGLAAELWRAACRRHFRSIVMRRALVLHGVGGQVLELLARPTANAWTMTSLGRSLGVDRTTIWRHVRKLVQEGLLVIDGDGRPRIAE
jgi:CRP-like cAMP-binding protein